MRRGLSHLVLAAALMSCRGQSTTAPQVCPSVEPDTAGSLGTELDTSADAQWFRAAMANDPRLSGIDVDARLSALTAALAEDPDASLLVVEQWSADVGTPLVALDAGWLHRAQPDLEALAAAVDRLPGTAPVVAGVSSSCSQPDGVAVVLARRAIVLDKPVPRDARRFVFRSAGDAEARFSALVLHESGVETLEAVATDDGYVVERESGFAGTTVELVTVTRSGPFERSRETVGVLRFSPDPGPAISTPSRVEEGINAVRDAWHLPAIEFAARGPVDCSHKPIEIGATPVTMRQLCAEAPIVGTEAERWELVSRRPLVLSGVADPRLTVGQIDGGAGGRLRLAERFEDLSAQQFRDALTDELSKRWPTATVRASDDDKARDLLQRWSDEQTLNTPDWAMQEAAHLAGAYSGDERSRYVLSVAQAVRDTLPYAEGLPVAEFQVNVLRTTGRGGEPLFWSLILTAAPAESN